MNDMMVYYYDWHFFHPSSFIMSVYVCAVLLAQRQYPVTLLHHPILTLSPLL